jgi:hypothetical protein
MHITAVSTSIDLVYGCQKEGGGGDVSLEGRST